MQGRDVVLATATASGKSLCFQVPIVESVLADPRSRALLLFPTKALARDQVRSLRELGCGRVRLVRRAGHGPRGAAGLRGL
jgi:ATP-dependent helicase YprA (DUF1998 family)